MSLKVRITQDMKLALKAHDKPRLSAIRLLLAALKQKEIDDRVVLDDAAVWSIIDKLIKQRRDSINQFVAARRGDLVDVESAEIQVLSAYLPAQLTADQIDAEIQAVLDDIAPEGPSGPALIGKAMGVLKPRLAGRADLSFVSAKLKERLARL